MPAVPTPAPQPCPQICPPPPPAKMPCRVKPLMRRLHWAQTMSHVTYAMVLAAIGGAAYYFLVSQPKIAAYKDYYAKAELDDFEDEMARKGLFQSVPPASLKDGKK